MSTPTNQKVEEWMFGDEPNEEIMITISLHVAKVLRDALRKRSLPSNLTRDEYDALFHINAKIGIAERRRY